MVTVVVTETIFFGAVMVLHCFGAVTVLYFVLPGTVVIAVIVLG